MGSIENAYLTGFICRLCSKMDRNVIHIYGEKGKGMKLLLIIRRYLSISVTQGDALPKTICLSCANSIIGQYNFIEDVRKKKQFLMDYQQHKKLPINELLNNRRALDGG